MKTKQTQKRRTETSRRLKFETLETRRLLADGAANVFALENLAETVQSVEAETNGADSWYVLSPETLNPSADEQEFLEQINRFRADPAGELERLFSVANADELIARNPLVAGAISLYQYPRTTIETFLNEWASLSSSAPLALNGALQSAAKTHTDLMISANAVSHQLSGEKNLSTRVVGAGFNAGLTTEDDSPALSENVGGGMAANDSFSIASFALASFAIDWGVSSHSHRDALTNGDYTEIGVSLLQTSKRIGPGVVTTDFGTSVDGARTDGAYLLGVVYDDDDLDMFYDAGEGIGSAKITVERLGGELGVVQTVEISSMNSGGYQLFLLNGSYKITVEGDAFSSSITKNVSIVDGINEKLDFKTSEAGAAAPTVDLNGDEEGSGWRAVFSEGASEPLEALKASQITIVDVDSPYLFGAKIQLLSRPDGVDESLDIFVAETGLRASFDKQGAVISLTGVGTPTEYEEVIASLSYFNGKERCDLSDRAVAISVYDGVFWSDEAILTISAAPTVLPNMTVEEMVAYEGDEGAKIATFEVTLDSPARLDVSFNYRVVVGNGTAVEGENFVLPIGDPITIKAGETKAAIECYINGDYDALKPEGLAAVEGGFENPSTYFYLEIVELVNANLTNENALVKGTIYDDDSPIVLGEVDQYEFAGALSTDFGMRRYIFSLKSETSGYFGWTTESLDLPGNLSISVRKESLDSIPIALSDATEKGQKVQWFADPNVEYLITIECDADFSTVAAKLLPITDDNVVLVDPVLADADEELLNLFWADDGLDVAIDDFSWRFDSSFFNGSVPFPTFQTATNPSAPVVFQLRNDAAGSVSTSSNGDTIWTGSSGGSTTISGFADITYTGSGSRENLNFVGSLGDDYLYYSNGSGFFQTQNLTYRFSKVNSVAIDAGSDGNDVAYVEDSASNDFLKTSNNSFGLYGGGASLVAKNFTDINVAFINGGDDSYYATDSGDDVSAVVAKSSSIVSGTFPAQENASENDSEPVRAYRRVVSKSLTTTFSPVEAIGSVAVFGDDSSDSYFDAEVGSLSTSNEATHWKTVAYRVKSATISGVPESSDERFNVATPDGEYEIEKDERFVSIVDSNGWKLSVPSWKNFAVASTVSLETSLDEAFAEFNDFCENDDWTDAVLNLPLASSETPNVFETLDSLNSDDLDLFDDSILTKNRRRAK